MNELIELKNLLKENPNLTRTEKVLLLIETMMETLPLPVQLLVKTNLSTVTRYIESVNEEEMDMCLDALADIIADVRGC